MKKIKHKTKFKAKEIENYTPKEIAGNLKLMRAVKKLKNILTRKGFEHCFDTLLKMKENDN